MSVDNNTRHHLDRRLEQIEDVGRSFFARLGFDEGDPTSEYEAMVGMTLVSLRNSGRSISESESEEEWYAVPVLGWRRTSRLSSSVPCDEVEIRLGIVNRE